MGTAIGVLILAAGIAFGANSTRIATVLEYGTYSTRGAANLPGEQQEGESGLGKAYAFNWSQGKLETFTLLVPYLYGGGSVEALRPDSQSEKVLRQQGADGSQIRGFTAGAPTYWGDQPGTGGPIYGGALMLGLFILGLLFAEKSYRWIFLGMALTGIILALGANLSSVNYFLFDYLPGYNKFRAVTMALSITLFAIPILGALGAEQFLAKDWPEKKRYQGLAIMAGVPLVFLLFGALFLDFRGKVDANLPDWLVDALRADRRSLFLRSAFSSLAMILGSAALLWAIWKNKLRSEIGIGLMVLILTVDLWIINKRYLGEEAMRTSPAAAFFGETPADKKIAEDSGYFRVFNLENPFNEARTSYRFASIGGYHGAKMRRYQELIEAGISPEIDNFILAAQEGQFNYQDLPILNMLNTRYLMAGRSEQSVFRNPRASVRPGFPERWCMYVAHRKRWIN
ncbi:hypothetical protein [Nitritalea halalkaliphila]|uniref:hypothetical protein n=1 Tax=Nitritalea halalkaliphila TaxID=590849 RepID=UPI00030891CF|nr:hypothetical protein [Nitritalea halalkaliphila]